MSQPATASPPASSSDRHQAPGALETASGPGGGDGADGPASAADAGDGPGDGAGQPRGRWRSIAVWTLVAVVLTTLIALVAGGRGSSDQPLDPTNPGPGGAQALARVLEQQGVEVDVARGQDALLSQPLGADTIVVISRTEQLTPQTGGAALEHAGEAAGVVLLDPGPALPDELGLPVDGQSRSSEQVLTAECETDLVRSGETIRGVRTLFGTGGSGAEPCFPPNETFNVGGAAAGHVVQLPRDGARPPVLLIGGADLVRNDTITDESHAAIALRALGRTPRLVWYVPAITDALGSGSADGGDFYGQLPAFVLPGLVVVAASVPVLMFWRGRRLGRLVTEPLPVIVRAAETTESRGRLYRKAHDRERALASLQAASRRRMAARLGLTAAARPEELTHAVAEASGRHTPSSGRYAHDEVSRLLHDPTAADDATLLHAANQLASLEEEVRRR